MNFNLTQGVKLILVINIAVFVLTMIFPQLMNFFALHDIHSGSFFPTQFISHMFTHGGVNHIFMNMLFVVFMAPSLEHFLGTKRFINFTMLCGILVGVLWFLVYSYNPTINGLIPYQGGSGGIVGFSGVTSGILLISALYFPNINVNIMFIPIDIKLKYVVMASFAYELYSLYNPGGDRISHLAHILGGLVGFLIYQGWKYYDSRNYQ